MRANVIGPTDANMSSYKGNNAWVKIGGIISATRLAPEKYVFFCHILLHVLIFSLIFSYSSSGTSMETGLRLVAGSYSKRGRRKCLTRLSLILI